MSKKDSALMVGIDESTFYRWIYSDASFASRVEASILEYKHTLVNNVNTIAVNDDRLALEVLKRRFPKEWGRLPNDVRTFYSTVIPQELQFYKGAFHQLSL